MRLIFSLFARLGDYKEKITTTDNSLYITCEPSVLGISRRVLLSTHSYNSWFSAISQSEIYEIGCRYHMRTLSKPSPQAM